jgi:4-oxalomesaconate tautomerase
VQTDALKKIEKVRLEAGKRMGLGDVGDAVVPKMCLISRPLQGGCINTRSLIPRKCHSSVGVFAAVSVATACVLPGTVAFDIAAIPEGNVKLMNVEHPTGEFQVRLEMAGAGDTLRVERGGVIRTARALFDGTVFARSKAKTPQVNV